MDIRDEPLPYYGPKVDAEPPDELVPDPKVWEEFDITSMAGWRWTHDPSLNFPPPIKIRNRNYRSRRMIEEFKRRMLRLAIGERAAAMP